VSSPRVTAVVPLRDGRSGKSRLQNVLDSPDRARLVAALARHVVATLLATPGVDDVLVVTAAHAVGAPAVDTATEPRLRIVAQPEDRPGLNAAIDLARELTTAAAAGTRARLLVIHADLPALTPDDVTALLATTAPVVLAPDRLAAGTNALVVDADRSDFVFRFGPGSFDAHRREAERLGLATGVLTRAAISVDLDTRDDWAALPAAVRDRVIGVVPALAAL
jgi:2-phospho-L-lactate/phosphoenolpyruvate guanylyltransferase